MVLSRVTAIGVVVAILFASIKQTRDNCGVFLRQSLGTRQALQ
jgi:hypothetical protein